jgi:predicted AlkP superfamily pyrophosphatase or phosphodiesterase
MHRLAVINAVGLTQRWLGPATPHLQALLQAGTSAPIEPACPAVTCTAQATYLTGAPPRVHGIVGNGWYDRHLAEIHFWKQSNRLVTAPKIWDRLRTEIPGFTCAQLFWWFNMYASVDYAITPRPMYLADGRKIFDIYAWPYSIRTDIKSELGAFPFAGFWGPAAGVSSPQGGPDAASRWIAESARWIERRHQPSLSLVYLPHLDYNLQRWGPNDPRANEDVRRLDQLVGGLVGFFQERGVRVLVVSEYGLTRVERGVHLNRVFRQHGWLTVKEELGRELLDAGASRAFAVADHQVAHIYLNDPALASAVRQAAESECGVAAVWGADEKQARGLDHPRAGDLVAVAEADAWFSYYYWLDDRRAPDFARTVDIHRKPGYDPVELFLDPAQPWIKGKIAWRLLQKRLGFRMLMDVVPLDASLVRGSHGAPPPDPRDWPVMIAGDRSGWDGSPVKATEVADVIRRMMLD